MAKVLLINSNRFGHPWPVIPFGLVSIATNLENNGQHNVRFLDLCFSGSCENVPITHAKEVLRGIIKLKLNLRLHTMGLTPSAIDGELRYKMHSEV